MKKENSNVHIKKKVICAVHVSTFDRSKYTRGFYRVNLKKFKNLKMKKDFSGSDFGMQERSVKGK